jgi:hypothetical protein
LSESLVPHFENPLVQALWYDAKGDWHMAHTIAQEVNTADGAWIHAYLHRKEGDEGNASYWYQRANRKLPKISLDEERENLLAELLKE